MSGTLSKRLARLEQRSRPDPAPVRFIVVTSDDQEGGPASGDERGAAGPARWFTIRIDRPGADEEAADDA